MGRTRYMQKFDCGLFKSCDLEERMKGSSMQHHDKIVCEGEKSVGHDSGSCPMVDSGISSVIQPVLSTTRTLVVIYIIKHVVLLSYRINYRAD